MKETDLYGPVKRWLEQKGYTVCPEVESLGRRADVVGVRDDKSIIVELKTSLSIEVMGQAVRWSGLANQVYVGVPYSTKGPHWFAMQVLADAGVGILYIDASGRCVKQLSAQKKALTGPPKNHIINKVTEHHHTQEIEGGHSGGGYVTEYSITIKGVRTFLESKGNKWVSLDDIMKNCKTHYKGNARSSLGKALMDFEHSWCEKSIVGRKIHFRRKKVQK